MSVCLSVSVYLSVFMYVCMYVHVCVCVCVTHLLHLNTRAHACAHSHTHTHTHTHTHARTQANMHAYFNYYASLMHAQYTHGSSMHNMQTYNAHNKISLYYMIGVKVSAFARIHCHLKYLTHIKPSISSSCRISWHACSSHCII